jgi:hypothetical protein
VTAALQQHAGATIAGGSPTWEDSLVIFASDNVGSVSILGGVVQVD